MFKINIEKYKLESYFLSILYLGIICGNVVIVIALFNSNIQDPFYLTYSVILQVYTPFTVSIGPIFYRYIFKRSHLILDLEDSREYLINTLEIEVSNPAEYYDGKPMAKYLRINLKNIGNKTARNCRIKMYAYYNNFQLIHEPSNIYPAGYHHSKARRKIPPLIDIAARDSQIFDICSSTNHNIDFRFIRFEDHFSFSRKEGKYHSLVHRPIYIRLFVYSDNNSPVEKRYKLFVDDSISGLEWEQINIEEYKWVELSSLQNTEVSRSVLRANESPFTTILDSTSDSSPIYEEDIITFG